MKQITASRATILYVMEQAIVKGISIGKKGQVDLDIESVVQSISKEFTNDLERYSNAKAKF